MTSGGIPGAYNWARSNLQPSVSCLRSSDCLQADEMYSTSSEDMAEPKQQSGRAGADAELPAGVQEGEPRPLKRSRRCAFRLARDHSVCREDQDITWWE